MVQINSYSPNKVKLLVHLMNKYTCNFISTWPYFIFFLFMGNGYPKHDFTIQDIFIEFLMLK